MVIGLFLPGYDRMNLWAVCETDSWNANGLFSWALIPNPAHLLLRTGATPISVLMRRLLTGYSVWSTFLSSATAPGKFLDTRFISLLVYKRVKNIVPWSWKNRHCQSERWHLNGPVRTACHFWLWMFKSNFSRQLRGPVMGRLPWLFSSGFGNKSYSHLSRRINRRKKFFQGRKRSCSWETCNNSKKWHHWGR